MQKWMITYAFLFYFLSSSLCGHAAPAEKASVQPSSKTVSRKADPFQEKSTGDSQGNYQSLHQHTQLSFSVTPSFTLGGNMIPISSDYIITQLMIAAEAERVLKDHLLHLFPSHYFW